MNSNPQVLTITQVTAAIKQRLESQFRAISLQGEISNFTKHSSGHLYFSLKDAQSQIGAVMFRGSAQGLGALPKEGDQVIVRGDVSVYAPRGQYQIVCRELFFVGVGDLLQRLEQLKIELHKRGWFSHEVKKQLPKFPKRIGVVTSPTGAAIQDICNVLARRHSGFQLILNPVRVQGAQAADEIAAAIRQMNQFQLCDVLIIGRGGGSLEDLWAFNEEVVAKAVFESEIPIISAVGHEVDMALTDYVADVRAPTPSAAAEIVLAEKGQQLEYLVRMRSRLQQTLVHLVSNAKQRLRRFSEHPLIKSPYQVLYNWMQVCDEKRVVLDRMMRHQLEQKKLRVLALEKQMTALRPSAQIAHYRERLVALHEHLKSIDPRNVLKKGYSVLMSDDGVIHSAKDLKKEQPISALMADGKAQLTVKEVEVYE